METLQPSLYTVMEQISRPTVLVKAFVASIVVALLLQWRRDLSFQGLQVRFGTW